MMDYDVYDVWMEPAKNLTDAELSRQEWIEERAAILEFNAGLPRHEAERLAQQCWLNWEADQYEARNAARSHGDGSGAIPGDAVDGIA